MINTEKPLKLLYIGRNEKRSRFPVNSPFVDCLQEFGELTVIRNGEEWSQQQIVSLIQQTDILLTMWGSLRIPLEAIYNPGRLQYVCNITGGLKAWVPAEVIKAGIPVTNWGDAQAGEMAEAAVTLLLAVIKDLPRQISHIQTGGWRLPADQHHRGTLRDLKLGIYGLGMIGTKFVELIRPFGPEIIAFDPFVESLPDGCRRADRLHDLFAESQAVVIHAAWTPKTEGTVTAELLSLLPDHAVVINTARGEIIDQEALFVELASGRLRAGLDVLITDDPLPHDHPARSWDNCIITAHSLAKNNYNEPLIKNYELICLENLLRFKQNKPLRFLIDLDRYSRIT